MSLETLLEEIQTFIQNRRRPVAEDYPGIVPHLRDHLLEIRKCGDNHGSSQDLDNLTHGLLQFLAKKPDWSTIVDGYHAKLGGQAKAIQPVGQTSNPADYSAHPRPQFQVKINEIVRALGVEDPSDNQPIAETLSPSEIAKGLTDSEGTQP